MDGEKQRVNKQVGLQRVYNYAELVTYATRERFRILPTVSALSATLLVVATFNAELIQVDKFVKILLAVLLILIPISLWGMLLDLNNSEEHGVKKIIQITKEVAGADISNEINAVRKPSFLGYLPIFVNVILTLVIIVIVLLIFNVPVNNWFSLCRTLF